MPFKFTQSFNKGMNMDFSELRLPQDAVQFMKNMTANVNQNTGTPAQSGANMDVFSPLEGNAVLSVALPGGTNYCVGFYSSEQTNEGYFFLWNSNMDHSIWVIRGDSGLCELVYHGNLLPLQLNPLYFIAEGRCTLELRSYVDPVTGLETNFKFLIFTNNTIQQYYISVEDSINTDSFTAPTGYFAGAGTFYDPITLIHLGVPTPISDIGIIKVPISGADVGLQNQTINQAFQFRNKTVDVFGRESEHGIISQVAIDRVSGGCYGSSNAESRCFDITFDAGNPLVDTISIEYRTWAGNDTAAALQTGWIKYATINKWINSTGLQWYERSPNTVYYNPVTNLITYRFCADQQNIPIPTEETARTEPGLPRLSSGVFSVNKRIGLANNVRNFEPISPVETDKISYSAIIPEAPDCGILPMRKIVAYAYMYNFANVQAGYMQYELIDGVKTYIWGNQRGQCGDDTGNAVRLDQVFGDQDNPGFIFYLAGTQYNCVTQWGGLLPSGVFTPSPIMDGTGAFNRNILGEPVCQITIMAPPGKYLLRGASHKAKLTDPDYQNTSTYIGGIIEVNDLYSTGDPSNYSFNPIKEIEIDCTSGDVYFRNPTDPAFLIIDNSFGDTCMVDGYLCEQTGEGVPVEMNPINFSSYPDNAMPCYGSWFTDHNGFFFGGCPTQGVYLVIASDICTGTYAVGTILNSGIDGTFKGILHGDGSGDGSYCTELRSGNWKNKVYISRSGNVFPANARRKITQQINLCGAEGGVSNVPVVMTKGAISFTDSEGIATVIAHNRTNYAAVPWNTLTYLNPIGVPIFTINIPNYGVSPYADDKLIVTQRGYCRWTNCGGCVPAVPDQNIIYQPCGGSRDTTLSDVTISLENINVQGVQTGGKYAMCYWLVDNIGRRTFSQVRQGESGFVSMPSLNDIGYYRLPQIGYTIDPSFTVPSIFKKLIFGVSANTNFTDFFSWSIDYVQQVDNTGNTNTVNPTQTRIYYGSLNEYNKQNNLTINCNWQFIATGQNAQGQPVIGDVVQFIAKADGTFFPPGLFATVTNDQAGYFFTIDYQAALSDLTNGALFRVIRPQANQNNYIYYEQCKVLDIVDGRIPAGQLTGIIPYSDSYMLSRVLPVPILQGQPGVLAPGATPPNPIQYTSTNQNVTLDEAGYSTFNPNSNGVLIKSVNDAQTSFPFYFESPSPSDFWGSHLANRGRIGVANPQEAQQRIGTEVALSAALGDRGTFNGLSYFDSANTQVFDRNTWGNITVVLVEVGVCLVICDSDHFMVRYNATQLTVDADGNVNANNQNGIFTTPQRPPGTPFGCTMENINSIRKYLGKVYWIDADGRLILNNFSTSHDVSTYDAEKGIIGGYNGYLMNKVSAVNLRNANPGANGVYYFVGGIDPRTNEYYLTTFNIPSLAVPRYINIQPAIDLYGPETIYVDLNTGMLKGMASFTPEMYGMVPGYISGRNFFTFRRGLPYKHHQGSATTTPAKYANFYGIQCPCYVIPVANPDSEKVKRYFWVEVYTKQSIPGAPGQMPTALFYCEQITTEKGQMSRLKPLRWDIRDGFQTAELLCDMNTPFDPNLQPQTTTNKLTDGNPLIGRWMKLTLKTNDLWAGTYFEVSASIVGMNYIKISGE